MKLKIYGALAVGLLLAAGCSDKTCRPNSCDNSANTAAGLKEDGSKAVYSGVIPAADAAGIEYTLQLEYDSPDDGDYTLTEKSLGQDGQTAVSKGDFTVHKGTSQSADKRYIKLLPDHPDRASEMENSSEYVRYFLIDNDSTLTLTDASLQPAASGLSYTLTRK